MFAIIELPLFYNRSVYDSNVNVVIVYKSCRIRPEAETAYSLNTKQLLKTNNSLIKLYEIYT